MSLPKNVLYKNNIESSYARNYNNNIAPQNGTGPYAGGETIIINVPTGRNLVMSGADSVFKFGVTVTGGGVASNFLRLDRGGAHSLIKRIRIFHGSTLLSDIDNYNNLVAMMMALQQSGDSSHGKQSIMAGLESVGVVASSQSEPLLTGERLNPGAALGNGVTTTKRTYAIPMMNFVSYTDKYVPLFALNGAPLRFEIQLVATPAEAICTETAVVSFAVTDVEYIVNFMELSDSGMNIINSSLGGAPLKWVVQDYRNYSHSATIANNAQLSVPVPAKFNSLRSIFTSYRTKSAGEDTFFPLCSHHLGLSSYTWRLGSKTVPTKAPSTYTEMFCELMRAIGSVSDLNHEPNISSATYADVQAAVANNESATVPTINTHSNAFYKGIDLESYSSSGMDSVYQGYNSSTGDIFFNPVCGAAATAGQVVIDNYAYFDQVIVIENGYASVQF